MKKLKLPFFGFENLNENYSQAAQDLFVLSCLSGKTNGTFLDLGCSHPTKINNTFLLEKNFNWGGLSIDIDESLTSQYPSHRKTKAIPRDCTKLDFDEVLSYYNSNHIDYLSLDLEPANVTLECLKAIPFDKIEFSVITYEHDKYRFGDQYREESRKIFKQMGYELISSDVCSNNFPYEDWYYNPKYVNYEYIKVFEKNNSEWDLIIYE